MPVVKAAELVSSSELRAGRGAQTYPAAGVWEVSGNQGLESGFLGAQGIGEMPSWARGPERAGPRALRGPASSWGGEAGGPQPCLECVPSVTFLHSPRRDRPGSGDDRRPLGEGELGLSADSVWGATCDWSHPIPSLFR